MLLLLAFIIVAINISHTLIHLCFNMERKKPYKNRLVYSAAMIFFLGVLYLISPYTLVLTPLLHRVVWGVELNDKN